MAAAAISLSLIARKARPKRDRSSWSVTATSSTTRRKENIEFATVAVQRPAEQAGGRHRHAHRTAGHRFPSDIGPAHQLAERERHDGKIEQAHAAQGGNAGRGARNAADDRRRNDGQPPRNAERCHQDAAGVSAKPEIGDVGKCQQPEIADHQVEADAHRHIDQRCIEYILLIRIEPQRHRQQGKRDQPEQATQAVHPEPSDAHDRASAEEALWAQQQHEDRHQVAGDFDEHRVDVEAEQLLGHAKQDAADHGASQ